LYCIDISSSSNYLNCSLRWEPQKSNFGFLWLKINVCLFVCLFHFTPFSNSNSVI
jgi:hypothetical protein